MFWGLVLEPGKRYSTTVDKSFHVSMAALDCSSVKSDPEILSVVLECDGQENILCNLSKQRILQSHLDLNFMTGDKVTFEVRGNGIVHLSGYLVPEDDDDDYMNIPDYEDAEDEEDEEEESEESPEKNDKGKQKGKRKAEPPLLNDNKKKKLKPSVESDSDEESEDDDDDEDEVESATLPADSSDDDEEDDDDSDEEEDDDSDEEEEDESNDEEEEVVPPVLSKKQQKTPQSPNKKGQQTPNKQTPINKQQPKSANKQNTTTPLVNGSSPNQQLSNKKNKKEKQDTPAKTPVQNDLKGKNQKTPGSEAGTPQGKKKLEGGVLVKDIKEGNGPIAKNGQVVSVYYQGRLKSTNKMFDECKRGGPAFKFRLGKSEVIKGWDVGVNGMKVGGIRSITCPPNMAYGSKGSPPQIPPNSALVFQVELKAVN